MPDTYFFVPADQAHRLATVYRIGSDGEIARAPEGQRGQGHYVSGPRRSFAGGAGLVSTAGDYARFLEMIRKWWGTGRGPILAPRTVRLMTTDQARGVFTRPGRGFGFGFETTESFGGNGLDSEGAFGWSGAYGTVYRIDPSSGLVMLLMIQLLPSTTDIAQKFPTLVYQALVDRGC